MKKLPDRAGRDAPFAVLEGYWLWPRLLWTWMGASLLRPIRANDIWIHLATGQRQLAQHAFVRTDPFSLTCRGNTWINFEWAYQILLYGIYGWGHTPGVTLLKTALVLGTAYWLAKRLLRTTVSLPWQTAVVALFFWASSPGWADRPDLVTMCFLAALLYQLDLRKGRFTASASLWSWVLLFAVWANAHAGFVIGLGVAALYVAEEIVHDYRRNRWLGGWWAACVAGTCVNPYGLGLHLFIVKILRTASVAGQTEFQPPPWPEMAGFWIALIAAYALLWRTSSSAGRRRSLGWSTWIICIGTSAAAALHSRYAPIALLVVLPVSVTRLRQDSWYERGERMLQQHRRWIAPIGAGLLLLLCIRAVQNISFGFARGKFPIEACDFIARHHPVRRYYNDYNSGSYWIWRFQGDPPVFIDGHLPSVEGFLSLNQEVNRAKNGTPDDWNAFMDRYKLDGALLSYPAPGLQPSVFAVYFPRDRWALVYWDDQELIFIRRLPQLIGWLRKEEFSYLYPDMRPEDLRAYLERHPERRAFVERDICRGLAQHPSSTRARAFWQNAQTAAGQIASICQ